MAIWDALRHARNSQHAEHDSDSWRLLRRSTKEHAPPFTRRVGRTCFHLLPSVITNTAYRYRRAPRSNDGAAYHSDRVSFSLHFALPILSNVQYSIFLPYPLPPIPPRSPIMITSTITIPIPSPLFSTLYSDASSHLSYAN